MANERGNGLVIWVTASLLLLAVIGVFALFYFGAKQNAKNPQPVSKQSSTNSQITPQTPSSNRTTVPGMKSFSNQYLSLEYPSAYTLNESQPNAVELMSPIEPKDKGFQLGASELKISIYWQKSPDADTLENYLQDLINSKGGTGGEFDKGATYSGVFGVESIHFIDKLTNGSESYFLVNKGTRISIVKFPITTSRQNEFNKILSSVELPK